jgi:DNA-binding NarL/FixJ family response regulator
LVDLKLGAPGIFLKHNSPASLPTAIRLVMSGEMWVDQKVSQLMADQAQQGEEVSSGPWLSESEHRCIRGFLKGSPTRRLPPGSELPRGGEGFIAAVIPKDPGGTRT